MKKYFAFAMLLAITYGTLFISGCSDDTVTTPQSEHFQASGMIIYNESLSDTILYYHNGVLKPGYDSLFAPFNALGGHWTIKFLDADKNS